MGQGSKFTAATKAEGEGDGEAMPPGFAAQPSPPRVGVGVIVLREGRVLLGQRVGSHGAGSWALPGGHLEYGETIEACAAREVFEETGLVLTDMQRGPYTSDVFTLEGRHYVTLFVLARCEGEAELREPAKCAGWQWLRWADFPEPLFQPLATLRRSGYVPADAA
jgi:8-oxo-dGTP diphosphatase